MKSLDKEQEEALTKLIESLIDRPADFVGFELSEEGKKRIAEAYEQHKKYIEFIYGKRVDKALKGRE